MCPTSVRTALKDAASAARRAKAAAEEGLPEPAEPAPRALFGKSQGLKRCANPLCAVEFVDRDKNPTRAIMQYGINIGAELPLPVHMVQSNHHDGGPAPAPFMLMPSPLSSLQRPDVLELLQSLGLLS